MWSVASPCHDANLLHPQFVTVVAWLLVVSAGSLHAAVGPKSAPDLDISVPVVSGYEYSITRHALLIRYHQVRRRESLQGVPQILRWSLVKTTAGSFEVSPNPPLSPHILLLASSAPKAGPTCY